MNVDIRGYDIVSDAMVLGIVVRHLPPLKQEVAAPLNS
jgi:hypothetical protein